MIRTLLLLCLGLVASGCISFSAKDQPPRADLQSLPRMPAVSYELRTFGRPFMGATGPVEARVEPLFRLAFSEIRAGAAEAGQSELHVDLLLRQTSRHPGLSIGLGLFFIGSLGLIPAYSRDELYLDVRVQRDGETLKQYIYTAEMRTWLQLFLLPWAFRYDPENVGAEILDNMVLGFLEDLRRDLPGLTRTTGA